MHPHALVSRVASVRQRLSGPCLLLLLTACDASASLELIRVADDGWNFAEVSSGRPFVPRGVNYDHDSQGPCPLLLEEYWETRFSDVEQDFQEMAARGFNVVRVHLQFSRFVPRPFTVDPENLRRLDALVALARRTGVRLDLTGLAHYRREEIPRWVLDLDDDAMMEQEAFFWRQVAARYRDEPAIFCYNLQNEPLISPGDTETLVSAPHALCDSDGEGPQPARGFSYVQFHFRRAGARFTAFVQNKYGSEQKLKEAWSDYPRTGESWHNILRPTFGSPERRFRDDFRFRHQLAALWTRRMVEAIRAVDPTHLVTIGLIPHSLPFQDRGAVDRGEWLIYSSFSPYELAPWLDFVALHLYPETHGGQSNVDLMELVLRGAHQGKPVVIEETFPFAAADHHDEFLRRSLDSASGWLSFYWGKTQQELRASGTPGDAFVAAWLDRYERFIQTEVPAGGVRRAPPDVVERVSIGKLLTSVDARVGLADRFSMLRRQGKLLDPILEE